MGKQEEKLQEVITLEERLKSLEAQLEAEKDKNQARSQSYTIGKQPLDELVGFVPKRDPVVTKLPNGTKRVDF